MSNETKIYNYDEARKVITETATKLLTSRREPIPEIRHHLVDIAMMGSVSQHPDFAKFTSDHTGIRAVLNYLFQSSARLYAFTNEHMQKDDKLNEPRMKFVSIMLDKIQAEMAKLYKPKKTTNKDTNEAS